MTDATADLLAALKLAADPEAHGKLTTAIEEHRKAKADADAAIADLHNRAYQIDKRIDQLHADIKAHNAAKTELESARSKHDLEVSVFRQVQSDAARAKDEFDARMRDLISRENSLKSRDEWLQNSKLEFERIKAAFEKKVSDVKALLG